MSSQNSSKLSESEKMENSTLRYTPTTEFITVPSFLLKTFEIVDDPTYDDIVKWNKAGDAFIITKATDFCEVILPMYFKHQNLSSFVRQLNMYGFHKTKYKNNEQCFTHKFFQKNNKKLLLQMKRKTKDKSSTKRAPSENYVPLTEFTKTINELKTKMKEQDKKINQLLRVNKEFKNSVLALYTELEKSKENERNAHKILINLNPMFQKSDNTNQILENNAIKQAPDSEEKNLVLENSEMVNMFNNLVENLRKTYQNKGSSAFKLEEPNTSNNFMLENGPS